MILALEVCNLHWRLICVQFCNFISIDQFVDSFIYRIALFPPFQCSNANFFIAEQFSVWFIRRCARTCLALYLYFFFGSIQLHIFWYHLWIFSLIELKASENISQSVGLTAENIKSMMVGETILSCTNFNHHLLHTAAANERVKYFSFLFNSSVSCMLNLVSTSRHSHVHVACIREHFFFLVLYFHSWKYLTALHKWRICSVEPGTSDSSCNWMK